ncbi:hypothetical protein BHM03_00013014 [Ensete ventricosum]|nr:hypothetical protein BHM03_00013014 [Ensete ventricosum]
MVINFTQSRVSIVFRALSQHFKILAMPNVLAHGKSYKHDFVKKCNGDKLCAKSRFDRFFRFIVQRLRISKYSPFPMY